MGKKEGLRNAVTFHNIFITYMSTMNVYALRILERSSNYLQVYCKSTKNIDIKNRSLVPDSSPFSSPDDHKTFTGHARIPRRIYYQSGRAT